MSKRKTGAKKKKEAMKERQKLIAARGEGVIALGESPANAAMICIGCGRRQKNRFFCYFCGCTQKTPQCASCGKTKCMAGSGDCLVKHAGQNVTGMGLSGAICDFCEAMVCHSRRCISTHACRCPLKDAACFECSRAISEHGGRVFQCASCGEWLCEDDQLEHQGTCQQLDSDGLKCMSCSRLGIWSCLRCKVAYCDDHIRRKGFKYPKGAKYPCLRCGHDVSETKTMSISARSIDFGRQAAGAEKITHGAAWLGLSTGDDDGGYPGYGQEESPPVFTFGGMTLNVGSGAHSGSAGAGAGGGYGYGGYDSEDEEDEEDPSEEEEEEDGDEGDDDDDSTVAKE